MKTTTNLGLKKIELTDSPPDITVQDFNWDKLDTEIQDLKDNKVVKETGKGLSSNDYTTTEKTKLSGIATGANNYTHPASHPASMITGLPTSLPANGGNADTVDGKHAADFVNIVNGTGIFPKAAGGGNEGGELLLEKAATSTLSGTGITIDTIDNRIRIFENAAGYRGCYIDIPSLGANVTTNLRDAVSVGGYSITTGVSGEWGLHPTIVGPGDLTAGVSSLATGAVYMLYE